MRMTREKHHLSTNYLDTFRLNFFVQKYAEYFLNTGYDIIFSSQFFYNINKYFESVCT